MKIQVVERTGEFENPEFGKTLMKPPRRILNPKKMGRVIAIFPDHLAGLCWS